MMLVSTFFDWTWIATALIGIVTYLVVNLWVKRRGLPPGPIPLPLLGNLLTFMDKKNKIDVKISNWRKKYGDVITLWMGLDPMVIVCGWDKLKDGLVTQKNSFSGRKVRFSSELFLGGNYDVILTDYGPKWEALRKLLHAAVRKYSSSENLPVLVDDVVRQITPLMLAEKEAFDPNDYMYLAVYNILASTAFGIRYDMNDKEFLSLKEANDDMTTELNVGTIVDVYPILKYVLRSKIKRIHTLVSKIRDPLAKHYKYHKETYTPGIIRDFTDACLAAKIEVEEEENQEKSDCFTDGNMELVVLDLFSAGTDTTRITMNWTLLYLSQYPETQEKIRQEIKKNIGDRVPVQGDKHKCPYTLAVITEILRIRPVVSFTLEHKATKDSVLDKYTIPKETSIIFHIFSQHMDPEFWKDPEEFRPERFLEEDGKFMTTTRFTGYLPFGLGRRACPGEKLALADLFLMLTGLLQKVRFSLPDGAGSGDLEPQNIMFVNLPKPYKLKAEKIQE